MQVLEIKLKNPISFQEIMHFKQTLINAPQCHFLVIQSGAHDFESLDVLRFFREQMYSLKPYLTRYVKIAFIHPHQYNYESNTPEVYQYFHNRHDAELWFMETI